MVLTSVANGFQHINLRIFVAAAHFARISFGSIHGMVSDFRHILRGTSCVLFNARISTPDAMPAFRYGIPPRPFQPRNTAIARSRRGEPSDIDRAVDVISFRRDHSRLAIRPSPALGAIPT